LTMTVKETLHWGHEQLVLTSESARLDAEVLLAHVLKKPLTFLLAHDDTEIGYFALHKYHRFINQRKEGMPVAYLTGHREFYGLDFEVNKHVLVPRPDTEILVECVISYLQSQISNLKSQILLDIGTGSACIPISILKNVPDIEAVATEISGSAMGVAKRNIKKHGLSGRIKLFSSDLLKSVPRELFEDREVVVTANLPYIPKQFAVHPSTKFEPGIALYGGDDGLDIYKRLVDELSDINPRAMFFECFEFQVATLADKIRGYELKTVRDMSGKAKMMMLLERNNL
jgi:release factor glutamine methyltransferase